MAKRVRFCFLTLIATLTLTGCTERGQLLEVYDVKGSEATARLTVDGNVVFTTSVYIGKNGIGKRREGDGKTPTGTLHAKSAFGVKANPGTTMPYIYITPSTFACDEDCEYYNRIIDTAKVHHRCKGEEMHNIVPQYNYGIATDYNEKCNRKAGSNIFVHCKGTKAYTEGCIAMDEDRMKELLMRCDRALKIKISK